MLVDFKVQSFQHVILVLNGILDVNGILVLFLRVDGSFNQSHWVLVRIHMHCKEQLWVANYLCIHVNRWFHSLSFNLKEYLTLVKVQIAFYSLASIDFLHVRHVFSCFSKDSSISTKQRIVVKMSISLRLRIKLDSKPNHNMVSLSIVCTDFDFNDVLIRLSFNSGERLKALSRFPSISTSVGCL